MMKPIKPFNSAMKGCLRPVLQQGRLDLKAADGNFFENGQSLLVLRKGIRDSIRYSARARWSVNTSDKETG